MQNFWDQFDDKQFSALTDKWTMDGVNSKIITIRQNTHDNGEHVTRARRIKSYFGPKTDDVEVTVVQFEDHGIFGLAGEG